MLKATLSVYIPCVNNCVQLSKRRCPSTLTTSSYCCLTTKPCCENLLLSIDNTHMIYNARYG